jgi:hypothetical protein
MKNKTIAGRLSGVNGMSTKLGKKLTKGSVDFIVSNAGKLSGRSIANILHRPLKTIQSVAHRNGVSLKVG